MGQPIFGMLADYQPEGAAEAADVARVRALEADSPDPWPRSLPLHVTASALIVCPDNGQMLLRWHQRQQAWLQVGGHGDPGESDPLAIALREAREETGLTDLVAWPDSDAPAPIQVVVVPVPAGKGEPTHHHADMRYGLATATPDDAMPETEVAQLRWMYLEDAMKDVVEDNLRICLLRIGEMFTKS